MLILALLLTRHVTSGNRLTHTGLCDIWQNCIASSCTFRLSPS